jgi:CMP-2-keto-3-deoxyoctulosonic acid synthetase
MVIKICYTEFKSNTNCNPRQDIASIINYQAYSFTIQQETFKETLKELKQQNLKPSTCICKTSSQKWSYIKCI